MGLANQSNQSPAKQSSNREDVISMIKARQSQEIVIALCGPIGCGIRGIEQQLKQVLLEEDYEVIDIRVSTEITTYIKKIKAHIRDYDKNNKADRYNALMDAGDYLRQTTTEDIAAQLAIQKIAEYHDELAKKQDTTIENIALQRRVFIISQLKHPSEVETLKITYGNIFYLIGVLCDEERRKTSLHGEGIKSDEANSLIVRDRKENENHGQQLEKTIFNSDFFINNTNPNSSLTKSLLERFIKLTHGNMGVTPTKEEYGMYSAYSASLQSACLSRQVGAAIADEHGTILSVGHNDVPKFGGGLYTEDNNPLTNNLDYRCIHKDQQCHNDLHKLRLRDTLAGILHTTLKDIIDEHPKMDKELIDAFSSTEIAQKLYSDSPIKQLIEYSRAIHAEMDAILSFARSNSHIPQNSTIYSTTFPCHNCARHIIAAGINHVVYIEPYEKSLAINLHDDALSFTDSNSKVQLKLFQGVAPARYQAFFSNTTPAKDSAGKMEPHNKGHGTLVEKEYVNPYWERETKIAANVLKSIESKKEIITTDKIK